ncbi:MAG: hypothetical protein SCALA702_06240 [Melioribacteraceae bacterium]|nr:MAG: hypothetical protein SCALA702_06240 [Melioribacteraceae bacterium]
MWFGLALISALFSAAAAVSQKKVLFNIDAVRFSFILSLFNLGLLIPVLLFHIPQIPEPNILISVIVKSFLASAAFLYVMRALKSFEISSALPLLALTPGIVAILSFLLLGDLISLFGVAGIFLMIAGSYVLESSNAGSWMDPLKVLLYGKNRKYIFLALGIFSFTSVLDRLILWKYKLPPLDFLMIQQFFSVIFFAVFYSFSRGKTGEEKLSVPVKKYLYFFLFISILTLGYRYFQMEAVKLAPAALVLSVKRLSILFAIVIGGKLFSEKGLYRKITATLIILAGLFLIQNF